MRFQAVIRVVVVIIKEPRLNGQREIIFSAVEFFNGGKNG